MKVNMPAVLLGGGQRENRVGSVTLRWWKNLYLHLRIMAD
jgi:hypothetical protein